MWENVKLTRDGHCLNVFGCTGNQRKTFEKKSSFVEHMAITETPGLDELRIRLFE